MLEAELVTLSSSGQLHCGRWVGMLGAALGLQTTFPQQWEAGSDLVSLLLAYLLAQQTMSLFLH